MLEMTDEMLLGDSQTSDKHLNLLQEYVEKGCFNIVSDKKSVRSPSISQNAILIESGQIVYIVLTAIILVYESRNKTKTS